MQHILVLGARCPGGYPGSLLRARLRRALPLVDARLRAGLDPLVVVSGKDEAEPMATWLTQHGVDPGRILLEPEATSTNENLEKAHALLPDTDRWIVVTSDFHVWRTRVWAWHLGIPVTVLPSITPRAVRAKNYLREVVAFPHTVARVLWRKAHARITPGR